MIIGKTTGDRCGTCGGKLHPLHVLNDPIGYYVGRVCGSCGPYSRETINFTNWEEADAELGFYYKNGYFKNPCK